MCAALYQKNGTLPHQILDLDPYQVRNILLRPEKGSSHLPASEKELKALLKTMS